MPPSNSTGTRPATWATIEGSCPIDEGAAKVTGPVLTQGDTVRLETSGGGGFGDPKARPPTDVARDVRDGYVSPEAAKSIYGYRGHGRG